MIELLALLAIGLLGGTSDDTYTSSSFDSSSHYDRLKYGLYDSHDIDDDGYCYDCDDYHDEF